LLIGIQIPGIMQLSGMQLSGRIQPRKDAFWFCHLVFYANKWDMKLNGMRLSGFVCTGKSLEKIYQSIMQISGRMMEE